MTPYFSFGLWDSPVRDGIPLQPSFILGRYVQRLVQKADYQVTSTNVPDHSLDLESLAGTCTTMSRKLTLSPQRHRRLPRRQCAQMGVASSHLRCRSRQVKHPVRTRFPFATFVMIVSGPVRFQSGPGMGVSGRCRLHALPKKRWRFRQRMETRRDEETDDDDDTGWLL